MARGLACLSNVHNNMDMYDQLMQSIILRDSDRVHDLILYAGRESIDLRQCINIPDVYTSNTLLHYATAYFHTYPDVIQRLLLVKANPMILNSASQRPIDCLNSPFILSSITPIRVVDTMNENSLRTFSLLVTALTDTDDDSALKDSDCSNIQNGAPPITELYGDEIQDFQPGFVVRSRYKILEPIGEGSFGKVYKALDIQTTRNSDHRVIIKVTKNNSTNYDNLEEVNVEKNALQHINKNGIIPGLVHQLGSFTVNNHQCFVLPYYGNTTLHTLIQQKQFLSLYATAKLGNHLLIGLVHLKKLKMIHRDLKPHNIIISENGFPVIVDVGSAYIYNEKENGKFAYVTSRWYRAPEIVKLFVDISEPDDGRVIHSMRSEHIKYDYRVDLWSFFCIISECTNGKPLFPGCHNLVYPETTDGPSQMELIYRVCGIPPAHAISSNDFYFNFGGIPKNLSWTYYSSTLDNEFQVTKNRWRWDPHSLNGIDRSIQFMDLIGRSLRFDPDDRITLEEVQQHSFFRWVH